MEPSRVINAQDLIDSSPFSRLQRRVLALCFVLAMVDGFDGLVIGFVVPAISADWKISAAALTPIILGGTLGALVGALLLAPLADRIGRRILIIVGLLDFGVLTLVGAFAANIEQLAVMRFVASLGLGVVAPNLFGYLAEFAPQRVRATVVTLAGVGIAAGGFLGGFAASYLVPSFGWRSVFMLGGIMPLALVLVALKGLPETIHYAIVRGRTRHAARLLQRIAPQGDVNTDAVIILPEKARHAKIPFASFFTDGRALTTVLLWIVYFNGYLVSFFILSWLPTLLTDDRLGQRIPLIATSVLMAGGIIGGVLLGLASDRVRLPTRMLAGSTALAAAATLVVAETVGALVPMMIAIFAVGIGVSGTQACQNAVTAGLYPAKIRATGLGWAYGVGRIGSLVGPAIGGALLAAQLAPRLILLLTAVPSVVAAIAMGALSLRRVRAAAVTQPATAESAQRLAGP